jgi:hypothetical protein
MAAQYTIGQQLPNGATVAADTFTTLPDGSTVEFMVDSARNETTVTVPGAGSPGANQQSLQSKAKTALTANAAYLAGNPTTAQAVAQVAALTRQINALIKLQLGQLDDTSGT